MGSVSAAKSRSVCRAASSSAAQNYANTATRGVFCSQQWQGEAVANY